MKTCSVPGCNKKIIARGLCSRHHQQIIMGKAPFNQNRSRVDGNQASVHGNIAYIPLYGADGDVCATAVCDSCFLSFIECHSWSYSGGYARSTKNHINMQDIILCKPCEGFVVDHINRDGTDNRYSNLRLVRIGLNNANHGISIKNKSGYIGVCFDKRRSLFCASVSINGRRVFFKRFKNIEEAARERDVYAKMYFGNVAVLNFPEGKHDRYPI